MILAILKSSGKVDELIHELKMMDRSSMSTVVHDRIHFGLILSGPHDFCIWIYNSSWRTSVSNIGARNKELFILLLKYFIKFLSALPFFLSKFVPTLLKKSLKISAMALSSVILTQLTRSDDMSHLCCFELFKIGPKGFHKLLASFFLWFRMFML